MKEAQFEAAIMTALQDIVDKKTGLNIVKAGLLESVTLDNKKVKIELSVRDEMTKEERFALEDQVANSVEQVDGVDECLINTVTQSKVKPASPQGGGCAHGHHQGDSPQGGGCGHGGHDHGHNHSHEPPAPKKIPGVGKVIAVASGKGGVGKSTVAVNLALALKELGHSVGLLDIDIYGPSLPILLGSKPQPEVSKEDSIVPPEVFGLKVMSLGFLMEEDVPVVWRGPMVTSAIKQFMEDLDWSGTDYLVIDLPPGTGDAQLALTQNVPVDGAIIVTTPSDLALVDASRGLQMFQMLNINVIGIVENMSYFCCPNCNHKTEIFGVGNRQNKANGLKAPYLGEIPLDIKVREGGDKGKPIVISDPDSEVTKAFLKFASAVVESELI